MSVSEALAGWLAINGALAVGVLSCLIIRANLWRRREEPPADELSVRRERREHTRTREDARA